MQFMVAGTIVSSPLVVTIDPNKLFCMINPENRDYITSFECIASASDFAYFTDFRDQHFT